MGLTVKMFEAARVDNASEVVRNRTVRARNGQAGYLAKQREQSVLSQLDPKLVKKTLGGQLRSLIKELRMAEFEFSRAIRQNLNLKALSKKGVKVKDLKHEVRATRLALKEVC